MTTPKTIGRHFAKLGIAILLELYSEAVADSPRKWKWRAESFSPQTSFAV
jgi:hypothetical protein